MKRELTQTVQSTCSSFPPSLPPSLPRWASINVPIPVPLPFSSFTGSLTPSLPPSLGGHQCSHPCPFALLLLHGHAGEPARGPAFLWWVEGGMEGGWEGGWEGGSDGRRMDRLCGNANPPSLPLSLPQASKACLSTHKPRPSPATGNFTRAAFRRLRACRRSSRGGGREEGAMCR